MSPGQTQKMQEGYTGVAAENNLMHLTNVNLYFFAAIININSISIDL